MSGTLFVIATPLGHLDDLSPRAAETLGSVACIACEDTRRTGRLMARLGVDTPLLSCHRFNERSRIEPVLDRLRAGEDVALVSDGGTPGVSDPGSLLVRAVVEAGFKVSPVPGPSAAATLLSVSGFSSDRYVFEGFLPHRAGERRRRLRELAVEPRTLVLFESPHRILATLGEIGEIFGDRPLVLGREMTKLHETLLRGSAGEIGRLLGGDVKGEVTLAIAGAPPDERREAIEPGARRLLDCWREALGEESGDRRAALRRAARALGLKRSELYRRLTELGEDPDRR